jgi:hypothetical protein
MIVPIHRGPHWLLANFQGVNMIYLIGGAPRAGKTLLSQQVAAHLQIGWVSTDLLAELLRLKKEEGIQSEWNATPEAITSYAEWFFPYFERFTWGASSLAENYLIEGVGFLPAQVRQLSEKYPIRSIFLGCSQMTLESLDQFPGRSPGYSYLPEALRRQIAHDVPFWSEFIRQECERFGCRYIDTADGFLQRLHEAEMALINSI